MKGVCDNPGIVSFTCDSFGFGAPVNNNKNEICKTRLLRRPHARLNGACTGLQDLFMLHLKFFERGFLDGSYAICSRIFTLLNMDSTRFGRSLQCSLFTSSKTSHHESDLSSDSPRE